MTSETSGDRADILTEVVLPGVVEPDGLLVRTRPIPPPAKGQALVQMLATGVSFAENAMRRNRYPGQPKFPFVPGYDLVGVVTAIGAGVDRALIGTRAAAVTKTGGWSTHLLVDARDLTAVPDGLDAAEVEAVLLNGVTAWQMLHRKAKVKRGDTILVHGGSGGVGTILLQLACDAGIAVIATASPRSHETIRDLGATPFDYRDPNLVDRVHALAPNGVNAVFDNIGGPSFKRSFEQLAPGGTLVGYGTASQLDDDNNLLLTFTGILARFATWTLSPNQGRTATFYNFWAGKHARPARFRQRLSTDLNHVLRLLADKGITPHIAARFPLDQASAALALADSHAAPGKIVITAARRGA
jgi:NADPH:quinone reductase-like Zn-dependent oxidoreductase